MGQLPGRFQGRLMMRFQTAERVTVTRARELPVNQEYHVAYQVRIVLLRCPQTNPKFEVG